MSYLHECLLFEEPRGAIPPPEPPFTIAARRSERSLHKLPVAAVEIIPRARLGNPVAFAFFARGFDGIAVIVVAGGRFSIVRRTLRVTGISYTVTPEEMLLTLLLI